MAARIKSHSSKATKIAGPMKQKTINLFAGIVLIAGTIFFTIVPANADTVKQYCCTAGDGRARCCGPHLCYCQLNSCSC